MTHYRVPFFEALSDVLGSRSIELVLAYGEGTSEERKKDDEGFFSNAVRLRTRYFFSDRICIQPFGRLARVCDMSVIALENKLLCNLREQLFARDRKVALWGHGANLQGDPSSLGERFKRVMARRADWWFGYTRHSVPLILQSGFPEDRITVLDNAVDTQEMARLFADVSAEDRKLFLEQIGFSGGCVGIFLGSLYSEKRIPFLLAAADRIRQHLPGFELLVVGGGVDRSLVESFAASRSWVRYLGVLKGRQKVLSLCASDVILNPGLVGLGILDSFVCEIPMVTTDCGLHSPEIAYLESGINGLMTPDELESFVEASVRILSDRAERDRLVRGCRSSAARYTVENMASNFADGVERCLATPGHRWPS
jgi:glycosyltransferase involved in cell wall biosynthesis